MSTTRLPQVAVVGAGPAGLMAAEVAVGAGVEVVVYDQRRSFGRTLLLAGRSGLNLTNVEPLEALLGRYEGRRLVEDAIRAFPPEAVRAWADGLGADTFVGSTGRVFPAAMRATTLVRAWLERLAEAGVVLRTGVPWTGFDGPGSDADAHVLALGGASWPKVGGDGSWVRPFEAEGIRVDPLRPSNVGVLVEWSRILLDRFEGAPLKNVALSIAGQTVRGEPTITASGLEGMPVYALGSAIRASVAAGHHTLSIDLQPDLDSAALTRRFAERRRPKDSFSTWMRRAGLPPVSVALLREATGNDLPADPEAVSRLAKAVPITLSGIGAMDRAISSAGGVAETEIDPTGMLLAKPGWWVAGEMMAWDAPTGGYLLQACLSTGRVAGEAAAAWALGPG